MRILKRKDGSSRKNFSRVCEPGALNRERKLPNRYFCIEHRIRERGLGRLGNCCKLRRVSHRFPQPLPCDRAGAPDFLLQEHDAVDKRLGARRAPGT